MSDDKEQYCKPGMSEGKNGSSDEIGHAVSLTKPSTKCKPIAFNVILLRRPPPHYCTVQSERTLTVSKIPDNVAELKKAIQQEFNVPIYDQKLLFGCSVMEDRETLDFYRLQDGDQITVEYTSTAEIESVVLLISNLRGIQDFLQSVQNQLKIYEYGISPELSSKISSVLSVKDLDRSALNLFCSNNQRPNTKFFINNGGLNVTAELHLLLLKQTCNEICHIDLLHLEKIVLFILVRIFVEIYQMQIDKSIINNIVSSFLRVSVSSTSHFTPPFNLKLRMISTVQQRDLFVDVILTAMECLQNITENEEYQIMVVSNAEVLKQFVGCLQNPSFTHHIHTRVMCCLENLSYNSFTHKFLCTSDIISAAINSTDMPSPVVQLGDMDPVLCTKLNCDLVRYFASMTIAQLVLTKEAIFPEHLVSKTSVFLSHYLCDVDFKLLHKWATEVCCIGWPDIFPVMRLVYSPCCYCPSSHSIDMLCLETGIFGLQVILNREDERQCLIKQGLLDYLICLPWHIPKWCGGHKRAKVLVETMGSHVPLQPPSLNNIVRAKLAATWCGLKKAMHSDWQQLVYGLGTD